ncbi:DNA phosphorothioation-dependent restriction protein DptG [Anaerobacillus sp. MEB173]|uniref:DNA phosphorothioation-dependent restriction protein DptG n=1 Tax=Anaerobacillus sp. MEB173 TaxID=3383345 RepID=UPI003F91E50C
MKLLIEELDNLIKEKKNKDGVTHDTGNIESILPLSSKKMTIGRERFSYVLGEFTRLISQVKYTQPDEEEVPFKDENPIILSISKVVDCENDDDRFDLNLFLDNFLFGNETELKQIHPYIFNYTAVSKQNVKANEEKKVAKFMRDVLVEDVSAFQKVFQKKQEENLLISLVLENLEGLEKQKESKQTYAPLLPILSNQFKEDFIFISNHRDYFLEHYPILAQYYYFLYLTQLTLKFSQYDKADYQKVDPLYFALDWESINKRRKAASDLEGYKRLRHKSSELFIHMHTMSQLSYNTNNVDSRRFMTYCDLVDTVQDEQAKLAFLETVNDWIHQYAKKAKLKQNIRTATDLTSAFEQLVDCLREGMNTQVYERYGEGVEDAASPRFLKSRGNIGNTLNITQDFLLLLTAISVKNERIPLKQLFEEFEKRGVALDRYSKKEVIELLDNLNIIDKKSDSGDAQYVKPIL